MSGDVYECIGTECGEVVITDLSKPYAYQNIFHVKLEVVARYPVDGGEEVFTRTLERMGVDEKELAEVKASLVGAFKATVLPYLARADFAEKLKIAKEKEKPVATGYGS